MNGMAASRVDTLHPGAAARREYFKLPRDLAALTSSFGIALPAQVQRDAAVLTFSIECADRLLDAIPQKRRRARFSASVVSDRKSTRLNSSHVRISYAVFCLKKKNAATPSLIVAPVSNCPASLVALWHAHMRSM